MTLIIYLTKKNNTHTAREFSCITEDPEKEWIEKSYIYLCYKKEIIDYQSFFLQRPSHQASEAYSNNIYICHLIEKREIAFYDMWGVFDFIFMLRKIKLLKLLQFPAIVCRSSPIYISISTNISLCVFFFVKNKIFFQLKWDIKKKVKTIEREESQPRTEK